MTSSVSAPYVSSKSPVPVIHLYSQDEANATTLDAVIASPRFPLGDALPDDRAGVYVLFVNSETRALSRYGSAITTGTFPIYIGSAQCLPRRLQQHRQTIASASGLSVADFSVCFIYTDSLPAALAVELILIRRVRPPWNERAMSGFGSKPQGSQRLVQRASGFDCLHRRRWAPATTSQGRSLARLALRDYLESGYVRPLWSEL